ncbi:peptidoglycan-binding protein LysM [candidate division KSB1 bacterium]|nr:peptidoglycan-binding protein LysM [candidate division KSB1 bacterium]
MGLFTFLKNAGANLLGVGKDEAKEVEKLLTTELGGKIADLKVGFDDGTISLQGKCDSQATREKAVLLAGNIQGVEQVNDDYLIAPQEDQSEFYTIVKGDTLSKIAKRYYGNAMKYPVIFEANREVIKDPDLIYPGQQIRIPKL